MDCLPLELSILVYESLENVDLAPTPYSQFTEEPADRLVYGDSDVRQHAGCNSCWIQLTHASCTDILNARLACSSLYNASHKTFARLLGDRRFRLTNFGFQDLILISRKKDLIPHIKTMTFGCATFRRNLGISESGFVWPSNFLSGLHLQDRARLAAAYLACRDWQHDNMESHTQLLASILRAFPNLDSIRMVTVDHVAHLGGWLKPGDEVLLHRDLYLYHDRSTEALRQRPPRSPPRLYNNESTVVRDCIIKALKLSKSILRDFRADPKPPCLGLVHACLFTPALHTLRISLPEQDLVHPDSPPWLEMLSEGTGLRDLSLRIDSQCNATRSKNFWSSNRQRIDIQKSISEQLLQALQKHTQLQRVELFGGWAFTEATMISFVAAHSDSLRCLILGEPLLFGMWQSALEAIAIATYGKIGFVKVRSPVECNSIRGRLVCDPILELEVLGFSCPFEWVTEGES
jgi:hypothetical protein